MKSMRICLTWLNWKRYHIQHITKLYYFFFCQVPVIVIATVMMLRHFFFSLVNKPGWAPVKLPQTGQYSYNGYSIYDCYSYLYGPTFGGGHDIHIARYASSSSSSYTDLGYAYGPPSGYSYGSTFTRTFLAGTYQFTPDEVETFYETT